MGTTLEEFSRRFENSPVKRTKRRGLLRNVAVAKKALRRREGVEEDGWVPEEIAAAQLAADGLTYGQPTPLDVSSAPVKEAVTLPDIG